MKPFTDIVAERPLAQHCEALLTPRTPAPDIDQCAQDFGDGVAKALREPLRELLGGAPVQLSCSGIEHAEASVLIARFKGQNTHFVVDGLVAHGGLVATVASQQALIVCDRAFGGNGTVAELESNAELPASANLILGRIGLLLATALGDMGACADTVNITRRGTNLERLTPFGCHADCLSITLKIAEDERESWAITLTGLATGFGAWLAGLGGPGRATSQDAPPRGPSDAPFADIPLPLRAVLADMRLPVARVSDLAPGDLVPLNIRREVPLFARNHQLGTGTIGTLDGCVALKLTRMTCPQGTTR